MAVFFVTALSESQPVLDLAIKQKFPNSFYVVEPDKWFIHVDGLATAQHVSDVLGITSAATQSIHGIVVSVAGYFGRAQPDVWKWLASKQKA
jgi:hypothetical protein